MDTSTRVAGSLTPSDRRAPHEERRRERTLPVLITVDEAADLGQMGLDDCAPLDELFVAAAQLEPVMLVKGGGGDPPGRLAHSLVKR